MKNDQKTFYVSWVVRSGWMCYSKKNQSYYVVVLPGVVVRIGKTDYAHDPGVFEKDE